MPETGFSRNPTQLPLPEPPDLEFVTTMTADVSPEREDAEQVSPGCCFMKEEKVRWAAGRTILELGQFSNLMDQAQTREENKGDEASGWTFNNSGQNFDLMGQWPKLG